MPKVLIILVSVFGMIAQAGHFTLAEAQNYPHTCPLHGVPLQSGLGDIQYGISGPELDHPNLYPYASAAIGGGCVVSNESPKQVQVKFCPVCRKVREETIATRNHNAAIAKSSSIMSEIEAILSGDDISALVILSENPNLNESHLNQMFDWSKDFSSWEQRTVRHMPHPEMNTGSETLRARLLGGLAKRFDTPPELLERISLVDDFLSSGDWEVSGLTIYRVAMLSALSSNPKTPTHVLTALKDAHLKNIIHPFNPYSASPSTDVIRELARNPSSPPELLEKIADTVISIAIEYRKNQNLEVNRDSYQMTSIPIELARNPSTPNEVLGALLREYSQTNLINNFEDNLPRVAMAALEYRASLKKQGSSESRNLVSLICRAFKDSRTPSAVVDIMIEQGAQSDCANYSWSHGYK